MGFVSGQDEVKGYSPYKEFKFEDIGSSITFMLAGTSNRNSSEWGEFTVAEVVQFNPEAKDIDAAVKSAALRSFALPTVLMNQVQNGLIVPNECYTVEFILDRGDKYVDTKTNKQAKAKAKHFKVMRLNVPQEGIDALSKLVPNKMVRSSATVSEPSPAPEVATPRV